MRYIVLVAFAAAVLWLMQDVIQDNEASAVPAKTEITDMGRIVIVGHREAK